MKRLHVSLEADLDAALALQARREGVSKTELVRRYLRDRLAAAPLLEFAGGSDAEPVDDIDEFLYGPPRP